MVHTFKTLIYAILIDAATLLYVFFVWIYQYVPNALIETLGDTHLQKAFQGGSAFIIFVLMLISRGYDLASRKRKYENDIKNQDYFNAYIMAGNTLLEGKHYESAIISYTKALELNHDNDAAQAKINEVKFIQDGNHK